MTLTIQLSPLLEAQLVSAAQRNGMETDAYVLKLLEDSVTEGAAERMKALLSRWRSEDQDAADEGDDFLEALDANRIGERKLFPPELKGITW